MKSIQHKMCKYFPLRLKSIKTQQTPKLLFNYVVEEQIYDCTFLPSQTMLNFAYLE